ncbi:hypothetical protein PQU94_05925 [Asticcacaulis sp. DXS10W]|uniref:Uncharacterized protein n=1 Tax=Asticcacaulis currens TaxID=2984210 RepID=A0ABT5ICB1_9CAUL|nr:hypothetical protein [Asticcacaulis currens]MDC7693819.1 hypothetical protein [Asticcacaulis currens]
MATREKRKFIWILPPVCVLGGICLALFLFPDMRQDIDPIKIFTSLWVFLFLSTQCLIRHFWPSNYRLDFGLGAFLCGLAVWAYAQEGAFSDVSHIPFLGWTACLLFAANLLLFVADVSKPLWKESSLS